MIQGTSEWLEWRRTGIGGSDAPIVDGRNKWGSMRDFWRDKKGMPPLKVKNTFILDRGNAIEPIARAKYELENGCIEMIPRVFRHFQKPYLIASLDGSNLEARAGLELKLIGIDNFKLIKDGQVPDHYIPQVQHQLIVTGFDYIDFAGYYLNPALAKDPDFFHRGELAQVRVYPDLDWIAQYIPKADAAWELVLNGTEPEEIVKEKKPRKSKKKELADG